MRQIIRKENSFFLGAAEVIANNLDFVFRYIYAVAYILFIASYFLQQMSQREGYTFLGAAIIGAIFILFFLLFQMFSFRKSFLNVDYSKAILFFFKCKCFKTKRILTDYE